MLAAAVVKATAKLGVIATKFPLDEVLPPQTTNGEQGSLTKFADHPRITPPPV